jgi:hypothetical protein
MAPACHALQGWATRAVHLNIEFRFRDFNPIPEYPPRVIADKGYGANKAPDCINGDRRNALLRLTVMTRHGAHRRAPCWPIR